MIPILLALLVQGQQPRQAPAGPAVAAPQGGQQEPRTPYDSTVAAIRRIALSVAQAKSSLESFNRAAAREPSGVVVERAASLRERCQALARSAAEDGRAVCRTCVTGERRAALERYRAYLATLQQVGNRCAADLVRDRRASEDAMAARLREQTRAINERLVGGLVPYEQRLQGVREAFGWAPAPGTPARRAN